MQTDPQLAADVRRLTSTQFQERYSCPFLGVTKVSVVQQDEAAFATGVFEFNAAALGVGLRNEDNMLAPVKKRDGAGQFSFITVGRATNNDIVVSAPSVSKCHFMLQQTVTGHSIMDAGSRNGTSVNGTALTAKRPHAIDSGDVILFAKGVSAVFLNASDAYKWLREAGI